jgi:hypothetical protein
MKSFDVTLDLAREFEIEFARIYNKDNKEKQMVHKDQAFEYDFDIVKNGKIAHKVELKTDGHISSNLFIEDFSNIGSQRVGGPWQALGYGADLFVIWFPLEHCDNLFVFKTQELIDWMEIFKHSFRKVHVENKTFTTSGYLVDKEHICCQQNIKPKVLTFSTPLKWKLN